MFGKFFLQNLLLLFFMGTMVRKEIYSPFQMCILCMGKKSSERDILILAGAVLKFMYIFKLKHMIHNYMIHK